MTEGVLAPKGAEMRNRRGKGIADDGRAEHRDDKATHTAQQCRAISVEDDICDSEGEAVGCCSVVGVTQLWLALAYAMG